MTGIRRITVPAPVMQRIRAAAAEAYPAECCGLLIGRSVDDGIAVTRLAESRNLAAETGRRDRFEVDPQLRFDLMRELRDGPSRIVGHYHSHPDHPAEPSARDLAAAFEPDLVWLIVAVRDGRPAETTAHLPAADGRRFRAIDLLVDDAWRGDGENP